MSIGRITESIKRTDNVISMATTVASEYLRRPWVDTLGMAMLGLVSGETVTLTSELEQLDLLEQLRPLYHLCNLEDDDDLSRLFPPGVPMSQVCDGNKDCPSGSDEASCVFTSKNLCNGEEFKCSSGQCVPLAARCDVLLDCYDGSDEQACDLECPHRRCVSGRCMPRPRFFDGQMDCEDGDDESEQVSSNDVCLFLCNRHLCVTEDMLNDKKVDCTGPEGPLDETIGSLEPFKCKAQDDVSIILNNWAPKCILAYDLFGQIIGCRDFQHLSNCEVFLCPKEYVKCPKSFCVPLAYVKDGKKDCDHGEDEGVNPLPNLVNVFKCNPWGGQAVPLSAVCDRRRDCVRGEDELDCGHQCPPGIICLAGAVSAVRFDKTKPLRNVSFIHPDTRYLDLSGVVGIHDFFSMYPAQHLKYLIVLLLSNCGIRDVHRDVETELSDFHMIKRADLSYNEITELPGQSYLTVMRGLEELNLAFNFRLSYLTQDSFAGLKMLKVLNLSFTGVSWLAPDALDDLLNLEKLSLKGSGISSTKFSLPAAIRYFNVELTAVEDVGANLFQKVKNMKEVRSSEYKVCCPEVLGPQIPSHIYQYTEEAMSSCTDLIKEPVLRFLVWLVALATLSGNITALVYRLVWGRDILQKPYGIFVINLGVADLLMGVYLAIIALADVLYHGKYALYDYNWRNSRICQTAGVLVTTSSLTSVLFISLITIERYLAIRYPYGEVRLSKLTVTLTVAAAWLFGLTTAFLVALQWNIFSRSGMCVALPLKLETIMWKRCAAGIFIGFHVFCTL